MTTAPITDRLRELFPDNESIDVFLGKIRIEGQPQWSRSDVLAWIEGRAEFPQQFLKDVLQFRRVNRRWLLTGKGQKLTKQDAPTGLKPQLICEVMQLGGSAKRIAFFAPIFWPLAFPDPEQARRAAAAMVRDLYRAQGDIESTIAALESQYGHQDAQS